MRLGICARVLMGIALLVVPFGVAWAGKTEDLLAGKERPAMTLGDAYFNTAEVAYSGSPDCFMGYCPNYGQCDPFSPSYDPFYCDDDDPIEENKRQEARCKMDCRARWPCQTGTDAELKECYANRKACMDSC